MAATAILQTRPRRHPDAVVSAGLDYEPAEITLAGASRIIDADGNYVYGASSTLRKSIKNGTLPAEFRGGEYWIKVADLRRTAVREGDVLLELRAAAERAAAAAPALSAASAELIASILSGGE